jgi:hypothetical protein
MSTVSSPAPRRSDQAVFSWIGSLFTLDSKQFRPVEGAIVTAIIFAPLLVLKAFGHEELWLSFAFGALFTRATDHAVKDAPSRSRTGWAVGFVLVGTLWTALAYTLGGANWLLVALVVLVSTFLSYLPSAYGPRGAVAGVLLNMWFLIALSATFSLGKTPAETLPLAGPQALAWLSGGSFWMIVAWVWRILFQRGPQNLSTPDQDASLGHISRPLLKFSGLAALAVASATAIAWGFRLPNADWMPISALVAMKPTFDASSTALA